MVGVLLVTHNGLGDSLADCVRHVLGMMPPHLKVLSVLAEEDPQQKRRFQKQRRGPNTTETKDVSADRYMPLSGKT